MTGRERVKAALTFTRPDRDAGHVNAACTKIDRFVLLPTTARSFERIQFLRGTQNVLVELLDGTTEFRRLLEMVHEFYVKDVSWWANTDVDGVFRKCGGRC